MTPSVEFDPGLVRRHDVAGPRYTSYPTAPWFHEGFGVDDYEASAAMADARRPLSLYFHLPFCATLCFYCACNKVVTKNRAHAGPYLERLAREIELQAELFGGRPSVDQLHWGGGTPTFLDAARLQWLFEHIRRAYPLRDDDGGDYSIELDPRTVDRETIGLLRRLGFNRASLGVQDLNEEVQRAVNRIQPEAVTRATLDACREAGFRSLNVDLIYGLPLQTLHSFTRTIDRVIELAPDRIALYNYAHLPERFPPQRRIRAEDLPGPEERLAILRRAIAHLTEAGYVYIGMDHFALPDDELARAQRAGTLTRNFQGYSTHGGCDLVAHGISAIGAFGNCYSQHSRERGPYYEALDAGRLPVARGLTLSPDDRLRRDVIMRLMCDFALDVPTLERQHGIDFEQALAAECAALEPLIADGLVRWQGRRLEVTSVGRLLVRNVAMVFDRYLQRDRDTRYSRAI
ncbi:MAG: oxygen-independent coproporphyrinogen III oxidase [Halofilum sp. (in: g-proteobacteria)]|nr:oxygen-independent coproporphyrinogen III oxidase [Halofilum sp. (in: g-proteobacteria)]